MLTTDVVLSKLWRGALKFRVSPVGVMTKLEPKPYTTSPAMANSLSIPASKTQWGGGATNKYQVNG